MSQPIGADEVRLRLAILANHGRNLRDHRDGLGPWVHKMASVDMIEKRAMAMLDKWDRKGWWEYGVSLRSGWLTAKGLVALTEWKAGLPTPEEVFEDFVAGCQERMNRDGD